jgi:hypothetical protein
MSAFKFSSIGLLLVGSLIFSEAQATTWAEQTVFGAGGELCPAWLANRKNDKADADISWVYGYVAAAALIHGPVLAKTNGLDDKHLLKEVDAICDKHPNLRLREAAEAVAVEHGLMPPPPD